MGIKWCENMTLFNEGCTSGILGMTGRYPGVIWRKKTFTRGSNISEGREQVVMKVHLVESILSKNSSQLRLI